MANRDDPERLRAIMSDYRGRLADERARLENMSAAFDKISSSIEESSMDINVAGSTCRLRPSPRFAEFCRPMTTKERHGRRSAGS